jgi:Xaa-Pro dipeptidase
MRSRTDLVFTPEEYQRRLAGIRARLVDLEVDALLVTGPENITYVTGYQSTGYYYLQVLVIPVDREPFMVLRRLEMTNIEARTWLELARPYADTDEAIARVAAALSEFGLAATRLGYDPGCYFLRATEQERLRELMPDAVLTRTPGVIEAERLIKSDEEIAIMGRAARATEAAMAAAVQAIQVGASENDVAAELHRAMFRAGGEYPACPPFVVSGPRCGIGHATWEGRTIARDDLVFLEIGGCVQRYHTAMMRTVYVGEPPDLVVQASGIVTHALNACMDAMRPGVLASEVDAVSRRILADNPFGATQVTRSGYSIGVAYSPDWGEGHIYSLQPDNQRPLAHNMVLHLIPWIQIPHLNASVGITETVRVTEAGGEPLTRFERQLLVRPGGPS